MPAPGDNPDTFGAPLAGRSVVVTRTREQSRQLAEPLQALGAEVIACPVIAIVDPPDLDPVDDAIRDLETYDWVVLTSTNAVERFIARLVLCDRSAEALSAVKVAVVGEATARRLERFGVTPDLVPDDYRAEGLVERFEAMGAGEGWRVLVPRALTAREILPETLRRRGAHVDVVPVYVTVPAEPDPGVIARLREGSIDAVTFTSPSTVRNFLAILAREGLDPAGVLAGVALASIGPVTTDALNEVGLSATVEADPSTMPVLVEALAAHLSASGGNGKP